MTGFFEQAMAVQANNENVAITENGAFGYRSTGKALLDLNFSIPQMRRMDALEIQSKWEAAYKENPELAMRWLFFLRDVRGGMGERRTFRIILKWMANVHPGEIRKLICTDNMFTQYVGEIIPFYGRWDDLMDLCSNEGVSRKVYAAIKKQLDKDVANMKTGNPVSLLAKWLPSLTTNKKTNKAARKLCKKIGMLETPYRQTVSQLREYLKVTEVKMSHRQWGEIDYSKVPSRAAMIYSKAFDRHDSERYQRFINAVNKGEQKINAGTLFPHEIVHRLKEAKYNSMDVETFEALWKNLPNTVEGGNTIVIRDGSGSMGIGVDRTSNVRAIDIADALSIYFAERLSGEFHNKLITFSERPQFVQFDERHTTLASKLDHLRHYTEASNTNIEAVFRLILQTAVTNKLSQDELPANLLLISDMEFDGCATTDSGYLRSGVGNARLFDVTAQEYAKYGYKIPRVVFWNVNSRTGAIPMVENDLGVALVSGFSINLAKMVMSGKTDPYECMVDQLENARYDPVSLALGYTRPEDYI